MVCPLRIDYPDVNYQVKNRQLAYSYISTEILQVIDILARTGPVMNITHLFGFMTDCQDPPARVPGEGQCRAKPQGDCTPVGE